jgi:hypothetical protein
MHIIFEIVSTTKIDLPSASSQSNSELQENDFLDDGIICAERLTKLLRLMRELYYLSGHQ